MDEINKIGQISSVNDIFDFKLSIKTIILIAGAWVFGCLILLVIMCGGVQNTFQYGMNILGNFKTIIVDIKNKNTARITDKNREKIIEKNTAKNTDKKSDETDENTDKK
jgi:hypothetical protein